MRRYETIINRKHVRNEEERRAGNGEIVGKERGASTLDPFERTMLGVDVLEFFKLLSDSIEGARMRASLDHNV